MTLFPTLHSRTDNSKLSPELVSAHAQLAPKHRDIAHEGKSAKRTPNVKCLLHSANWQKSAMGTIAERLKQARELAGFAGPHEAAAALGVNKFTYAQHENTNRGFKVDSAIHYARRYRVSLDWLLSGRGSPRPGKLPEIPVTGYVGAGAKIIPFADQGALDRIPAPPGFEDYEAAELRGDSMPPLQPGWKIVWRPQDSGVTEDLIGKLCVVGTKDGEMLIKILRKAKKKGLWDLESWNAPRREGVVLEWAAKVVDIRPD